jgi:hypothetical protein
LGMRAKSVPVVLVLGLLGQDTSCISQKDL